MRRSLSMMTAVTLATVSLVGCGGTEQNWDHLAPRQIRLSEIHYHDPFDAKNEFVELVNTGDEDVSLTGWCVEGIGFCFDGRNTIGAGRRVVIDSDKMKGSLRDSGETLTVVDGRGVERDSVSYGDRDPWPRGADGLGYSLQLHDLDAADDGAAGWTAAPPTPDEPYDHTAIGNLRVDANADIVIAEINYHDPEDDPRKEFVELLNRSARPVDVSGWRLTGDGVDVVLAPGTVLEPDGRHVIDGFPDGQDLGNGGGDLVLTDRAGAVEDAVTYDDDTMWPALADGHGDSLQRIDPDAASLEPGNWIAALPTPGKPMRADFTDLMPMFEDVSWTRAPSSVQPITVRALPRNAATAVLHYRVGFADETSIEMDLVDGALEAEIPPQEPGSLVRFRLSADNAGQVGTWPRQGDGSNYAGTVVAGAVPATSLPVIDWFLEPGVYGKANSDRTLNRDDGYPLVVAIGGDVFDNALIRMKGQQSRFNPKHKWKITLPAGHHVTDARFFSAPVDEFALNAMSTDKSYVREVLTSDLVGMIGGYQQKATPVRVQRNGEFQGVYVLTEQPDKTWRSLRGLSDQTIVYKAERQATMQTRHLELPEGEFRLRFKRLTQRYRDTDPELRKLIRTINLPDKQAKIDFAYTSVDIPQVINMIASMRVAQHFEWDHKNYEVMFDPEDGRWRLLAIDHDLNMGSRWHRPCGSFCWESRVYSYDHFKFNQFGALFINTTEFRAMLDRRTKTIAEQFFAGTAVEKRIADLATLYGGDDDLDVREWHSGWGKKANDVARQELIEGFVVKKREQLVEDPDGNFPPSQKSDIAYDIRYRRDGMISVTNRETTTIDLSGLTIPGVPSKIPAGVVLTKGQTVLFTRERTPLTEVPFVGDKRALVVWVPGWTSER